MTKKRSVGSRLTKREAVALTVEEKLKQPRREMSAIMAEAKYEALGYIQQHGFPDRRNRWQRHDGLQWGECTADDDPEVQRGEMGEIAWTLFDGSVDEETPRGIAVQIVSLVDRWVRAQRVAEQERSVETIDRMQWLAWKVGQLQRDLYWKHHHEAPAEEGYRSRNSRLKGTQTSKKNRTERVEVVRRVLTRRFSASDVARRRLKVLIGELRTDPVVSSWEASETVLGQYVHETGLRPKRQRRRTRE